MIAGDMVDCLANYFGLNDDGELTRYFCYHILGGPGPTPESGVASIDRTVTSAQFTLTADPAPA